MTPKAASAAATASLSSVLTALVAQRRIPPDHLATILDVAPEIFARGIDEGGRVVMALLRPHLSPPSKEN